MTFFTIKNIGLLLLLGVLVFPVGINQSYAQEGEFQASIADPVLSNTAPTADDINIQIVPDSEATIPFSANVMDAETDFDELTIQFSINNGDERTRQIMVTSGADQERNTDGDRINLFTLTAENVVITEGSQFGDTRLNPPRTVTLSYTVSDGALSDTGTVNISVVAVLTNTPPMTPDIEVSAAQGAAGEIPFSSITDNEDMAFAEYTSVTLDLTPASGVDNPAPNLSTQVVFNQADVDSSNTDDSRLLVTSETLGFTVNNAAALGQYNLVYTVTDSDGAVSTGNLLFTITGPIMVGGLDDLAFRITQQLLPTAMVGYNSFFYLQNLNHVDTFGLEMDDILDIIVSVESEGSRGGIATFTDNRATITEFTNYRATLTYTPVVGFFGIETFTYTGTTDDVVASGTLTFFVTPPAPNIVVTTVPNAAGTMSFSGITDDSDSFTNLDIVFHLTNSTASNPEPNLSTQVVFNPIDSALTDSNSRLTVSTEHLSFNVNPDATSGTYNLVYTVTDTDGGGGESTGSVIFTIAPPPPALDDRTFTVPMTTPPEQFEMIFPIAEYAELINYASIFDGEGDGVGAVSLTIDAIGSNNGAATFTTGGGPLVATLRYTPDTDFSGTETFTYTATLNDITASGTLTFNVEAPPPPALDDRTFTVPMTTPPEVFIETFNLAEFIDLINLEDSFGLSPDDITDITIVIEDASEVGTATFTHNNGNGDNFLATLRYTPDTDFSGTETFTYTANDGNTFVSGTLTFNVGSITPLDGDLDSISFSIPLSSLPTVTNTYNGQDYANLLNLEDTFSLEIGDVLDVVVTIDGTGSQGGTATFTNNGAAELADLTATLTYTPIPGISGTETFTYSGMTALGTATGTITFTIEEVSCETSLGADLTFGNLGQGETSDVSSISILNDGNVPVQSLIAGANWVSAADTSIDTMNAEQTRYSVTQTDAYDTRTPFTTAGVNVGGEIAVTENLDVYVQLLINLIDEAFRGQTTQTITITSDCS